MEQKTIAMDQTAGQQQGQPQEQQHQQQQPCALPAYLQLGDPHPYLRNPIADADKVVEALKAGGAIDAAFKKVAEALRHSDEFRGQVQQLMQDKGLLQPGLVCTTQGERNKKAADFVKNDVEQLLLTLAYDAIWEMLTDESKDAQGVAAEHQQAVKQAMIKVLADEEVAKLDAFKQHLKELQRRQQRL